MYQSEDLKKVLYGGIANSVLRKRQMRPNINTVLPQQTPKLLPSKPPYLKINPHR